MCGDVHARSRRNREDRRCSEYDYVIEMYMVLKTVRKGASMSNTVYVGACSNELSMRCAQVYEPIAMEVEALLIYTQECM